MNLLEARLVRVDIPSAPSIKCTVYSNGSKIGILSSVEYSDPENCLLIPMQGNLKILVSSVTGNLGSVTFPFTLINENGCLWLPILLNGSSDYIDTLPEELSSPKILMYFEKKTPEDIEEKTDELVETKEKLKNLTLNYQDFIKNAKNREIALIKSLEEKENEIQDYIEQLNKAQSRIFSLVAEKKTLGDSLSKLQIEISYSRSSELKEELELTQQELLKSEARNENLLRKLEELSGDWNFVEEESKHIKESELLAQISQLKSDVEIKNIEIAVLRSAQGPQVLAEISNKRDEKREVELNDTVKYSKPQKAVNSSNSEHLPNNSFMVERIQASIISEDDPVLMYSQPCSRGVSPGLKENVKKTLENDKTSCKSSFRYPTVSSQNKTRYVPIPTSRRTNLSAERRTAK